MDHKFILLVLLACCTTLSHAQRKPKIKGNRNVTEVRESLAPFLAVNVEDDLEIILEASASPGYSVTADDNLIDILKFKVEADTLFISSFYTVTAKRQLEIRVQYNELHAITMNDGSLSVQEILNTDALTVHAKATAHIQLNAKCSMMHLQMAEQSTGDFNLESDSLSVNLKNRAEASIYQVSDAVSAVLEDQSDAVLEGTTHTLNLHMYSGAELKAERLIADTIKASVEGTSKTHIRPSGLLELSSRGSANTYLYGDAEISILQFDDTSELYKRAE
jgi:hypothetical protein